MAEKEVSCPSCNGSGKREAQCPVCGGVRSSDYYSCYRCNGSGRVDENCGACSGTGRVKQSQWESAKSDSDSSSGSYTPSTPSRSLQPDKEARMNNEADGYFMAKNYDKAIPLYNQIIESGSRFKFSALFMRSKCY
ncbi:MAG: hypothetical protein LBQ69_05350, partial [Treponema sp.]|nr:hypothetical protein [Treponema sp.]